MTKTKTNEAAASATAGTSLPENFTARIREKYADSEIVRGVFDVLLAYGRDQSITFMGVMYERLRVSTARRQIVTENGITERLPEIDDLFFGFAEQGLGSWREDRGAFVWTASTLDLARTAANRPLGDVDIFERMEDVVQTFLLRAQTPAIELLLPRDFTRAESHRLAAWIRTLPLAEFHEDAIELIEGPERLMFASGCEPAEITKDDDVWLERGGSWIQGRVTSVKRGSLLRIKLSGQKKRAEVHFDEAKNGALRLVGRVVTEASLSPAA